MDDDGTNTGAWLRASVAALSLAAAPHGTAAQQVGTSAAIRGDVFLTPAARPVRRAASEGDDVFLADRVETATQSALQVLLLDDSVFTVAANADLTIDRFVYDPERDAGDVAARVARGAFRFVSGRTARRGTVATIATPAATIGIRGTFLEGWVGPTAVRAARALGIAVPPGTDPSQSMFVALRGPSSALGRGGQVDITNAAGSRTLARANQAVFVPGPRARPSRPVRYEGAARAILDEAIRSAPEGGETVAVPGASLPLDPAGEAILSGGGTAAPASGPDGGILGPGSPGDGFGGGPGAAAGGGLVGTVLPDDPPDDMLGDPPGDVPDDPPVEDDGDGGPVFVS